MHFIFSTKICMKKTLSLSLPLWKLASFQMWNQYVLLFHVCRMVILLRYNLHLSINLSFFFLQALKLQTTFYREDLNKQEIQDKIKPKLRQKQRRYKTFKPMIMTPYAVRENSTTYVDEKTNKQTKTKQATLTKKPGFLTCYGTCFLQ